MRRTRWRDVDAAIRDCLDGSSVLRAVDPEALSQRVSWERPNPRRKPTVRRTGSEGSPSRRDPLDAVARGRMRALLEELAPLQRACVVASCYGWVKAVARAAQRRPATCYDLAEDGKRALRRRMREVGLLEAA